jgi:hypothetical protein
MSSDSSAASVPSQQIPIGIKLISEAHAPELDSTSALTPATVSPGAAGATTLVILCASHIPAGAAGDARFRAFFDTLNSWIVQTVPVDLHLSISYEDTTGKVLGMLKRFTNLHPRLKIYPSTSRLSQFEHYGRLATVLSDIPHLWCLFLDDDDIMHRRRVEVHLAAICGAISASSDPAHLASVAWPQGVTPADNTSFELSGKPSEIQREIDKQVATGKMTVRNYGDGGSEDEYHYYAVPLRILAAYTTAASPTLLKHRYADCFFVRFLNRGSRESSRWQRVTATPPSEAMWYYAALTVESGTHSGNGEQNIAVPEELASTVPSSLGVLINNMACFLFSYTDSKKETLTLQASFASSGLFIPVPSLSDKELAFELFKLWGTDYFKALVDAPLLDMLAACDVCHQLRKTLCCSKCKVARYCSTACQKSAWSTHKATCTALAPLSSAQPQAPMVGGGAAPPHKN